MKIESQSTFERSLQDGINIFTGAGFSVLAKDKKGVRLPVGDELKQELLAEFPSAPKALQLPQLYTLLSKTKKSELENYIRSRFEVGEYNEKYKNIGLINSKFIFTTNVDNLLELVFYDDSNNKYLNDAFLNGASLQEKDAIDYIHLHGSISNNETRLIFSDLDIASAFSDDPTRWNYFRTLMNKYPTLFWGYALRDAGTLQVLSDSLDDNNKKNSWIIVHPEYTSEDEIQYYKSLDLKIIKSDTESFLEYLGKFKSVRELTDKKYSNPFPDYAIPSNTTVKHRAIQEFYQGATPNWSDIYSPRVSRLQYYSTIEESTNRRRNVLITGGPATGKTTLLMQFAAFYHFDGLKLFHSNISLEKAKHMVIPPFLTEVISRIRPYAEYAASVCSHSTPYWVVRDYKTIAIRSHSFVIHPVM